MESNDTNEINKTSGNDNKQTTANGTMLKPFTKKNWDAIIDEFEKEEEKEQGINELFKQIYESGNDDVRRAMNKSFQESGGTVLSTNWSNVAEKKVEPKPPSDSDGQKDIDLS